MKHKVDDLISNINHNSNELTKCLSDFQSNANKRCGVYCLYHSPHDEHYALKESINAQKNNRFVNFDHKAATSLLSNRTRNKLSPTPNKSQKALFGSGICGGLFTALLTVVLSIVDDRQWKIVLACVLAGLLLVCAAVSLVVLLADKRNSVARELSLEDLQKLKISDLTQRDFCYSATQNCILVVTEPTRNLEDDFLWQFFLQFAKCKPSKGTFNVLLLKTVFVNGDKHASESLGEKFAQDKRLLKDELKFETIMGGYLVPLTDLEKIQLVEELNLGGKIPIGFLAYGGRDFFYGFEDNGGMELDEYKETVNDVYNKISKELCLQNLSKEGVRQALSFLATLRLFLGVNKVANITDLMDISQNNGADVYSYFSEALQPSASNVDTCKRILQIIWSDADKLPRIVKREYALLTSSSEDSANLPILSYQKAVKCAIDLLEYKNKDFFLYEDMETDVTAFWDKIWYWYGVHNRNFRLANVSNNWLDVLTYLLEINMSCGYFARNCYLLCTVNELYQESLGVAEIGKFKQFYLSPTVKKAYEVNALVCPHCTVEGNIINTQKMHLNYLEHVVVWENVEVKSALMPHYFSFACKLGFELLPATDAAANLQRYYDLLSANNSTRLTDVFRSIYERCLELCKNRFILRFFSNHYEGQNIASAVESALTPIINCSHLSNVLHGDKDMKMLACGYTDCDLFYLMYNLEQGSDTLVFDSEIDDPCYRFAARLAYVERTDRVFSNIFNEMVYDMVSRAHSQFAEKYFLDRVNYNMHGDTKSKIVNYLADSNVDVDCEKMNCLSKNDTMELIPALYGIYKQLPNGNLLNNVQGIKCAQDAEKAWQYFCNIVLNKQPVAETDKQQFVEDIRELPSKVVYVLFISACKLDNTLCSAIPKVSSKILNSNYVNECTFVLDNINYVAEKERESLKSQVKDRIMLQMRLDFLPKDESILLKYIGFMRNNGDETSELEKMLIKLYVQISAMERESLRQGVGYLLRYAYNMINAVKAVLNLRFVSQFESELSESDLAARRKDLQLLVIKDNKFNLSKEFFALIAATLDSKVTLTDKDLAEFHKQTLEGLINFFELDYVKSRIENIGSHTTILKQMLKNTIRAK